MAGHHLDRVRERLMMSRARGMFLFLLVVLAAVAVEAVLQTFLPAPIPHAAASTMLMIALALFWWQTTWPWYALVPIVFAVMLAPPWVSGVLLAGAGLVWVWKSYLRRAATQK